MKAVALVFLAISLVACSSPNNEGRAIQDEKLGSTAPALQVSPSQPRTPRASSHSKFENHVTKLRKTLPAHYKVVVEPPFVVIGDGTLAQVRARAENTVRWAVKHLKKDFFAEDPAQILDVYLFETAAEYDAFNRKLGDVPDTPYGYYSPSDRALVMNIATGGGTLVHEIVHPFMEANFPDCPAWFNEGLGSLFEQSSARNGKIVGHTNWRLRGLQKAIRARKLPSFKWLTKTTEDVFYADERADNYAQARYLLYYLQEQGLLRTYYRLFLKNHERDPSGYQSLLTVLDRGEEEMADFEAKWQKWVLGLRFP
jgi:hypothetical protein